MWYPALLSILLALLWVAAAPTQSAAVAELSAATLRDKIRGSLLGQILGKPNGLEHEM